MPIKIPNNLPAVDILHQENIFVMPQDRAVTQDIRPLQILLVNLMPKKIQTEVQFSRLLGNTALQIELELVSPRSHIPQNTPPEHLQAFYKTFDEVKAKIDDWIDYYNNDRYQWELSKLSPKEFYRYSTTGVYPLSV